MPLAEVLDALEYSQSPYYLKTTTQQGPEMASLFRSAQNIGVDGIYVFRASNEENSTFSARSAVYVAEAQTPEEARAIHRSLWNLGQTPFLIVVLPNHIRVYTGFDYSQQDNNIGIIEPQVPLNRNSILDILADFCAESINNGKIWQKRSQHLKPEQRVDRRLLKNLEALGKFLREQMGLPSRNAHALIGKYVYIRYLYDRGILSAQWLEQHAIYIDNVLGRSATVHALQRLCAILDDRFNGNIFPLQFAGPDAPKDEHVEWVAGIFAGDEQLPGGGGRQLSLDFQAYDFAYIPIELLSSIYEQFLHVEGKGRQVGAYYTPEYLADYLIAEISSVKPLREGMKILDPSCGSGIFLVLIYARLIEIRLARSSGGGTLPLPELLTLLENIYGIERELDACYVTEFSLILMLLHYADLPELLYNEHSKLPSLHNSHIFHQDFFDDSAYIWKQNLKFDWIIGNPPWIVARMVDEPLAAAWIKAHSKLEPVDNNNIAEAFSWRVLDLLSPEGYAALILPAAFLYSIDARQYRQAFFERCEVKRTTDFSNLRAELFEGRATQPAVTLIYHQNIAGQEKSLIGHYGPFAINQVTKSHGKLWAITINEHEYQAVSPYEAARGDISTWKFALWGTHRDKLAIARLRKFFPQTLGQLCREKKQSGWHLHEGSQLRKHMIKSKDKLKYIPDLIGEKRLSTKALNKSGYLFSIPLEALEDIPLDECYIRVQGGEKGLLVSKPPHIVMNAGWKYCIYSDIYFAIKPRQIGLSAPLADRDHLRALSVFLSSGLVKYYLFFQASQWGIERDVITLESVKSIPVPTFTSEQIEQLAALQEKLVLIEREQGSGHAQAYLDEQVMRILQVPENIAMLVSEFLQLRSGLVGGGTKDAVQRVQRRPDQGALLAYAQQLTYNLDGFLASSKTHHRITIEQSPDLICCTIEFARSDRAFMPVIKEVSSQNGQVFQRLQQNLKQRFSQWIYVQRSLKIFEPSSISLYKVPQLINWTQTQAMSDADDVIAEMLSRRGGKDELFYLHRAAFTL